MDESILPRFSATTPEEGANLSLAKPNNPPPQALGGDKHDPLPTVEPPLKNRPHSENDRFLRRSTARDAIKRMFDPVYLEELTRERMQVWRNIITVFDEFEAACLLLNLEPTHRLGVYPKAVSVLTGKIRADYQPDRTEGGISKYSMDALRRIAKDLGFASALIFSEEAAEVSTRSGSPAFVLRKPERDRDSTQLVYQTAHTIYEAKGKNPTSSEVFAHLLGENGKTNDLTGLVSHVNGRTICLKDGSTLDEGKIRRAFNRLARSDISNK